MVQFRQETGDEAARHGRLTPQSAANDVREAVGVEVLRFLALLEITDGMTARGLPAAFGGVSV